MSDITFDIDYSLWEAYLADCQANNITPSTKDYTIFLQEADLDRAEREQE